MAQHRTPFRISRFGENMGLCGFKGNPLPSNLWGGELELNGLDTIL